MIRFCLLLLLLLPLRLLAQDGIHRCIGADGNPLFTDQPCAALQATPVTAPQREQAAPAVISPTPAAQPAVLCAANVGELRQTVVDAFATRDPNRLAGLMLWNGYAHDAVVADIRSLSSLMQHPLLDVGQASAEPDNTDGGDIHSPAATPDTSNRTRDDDRELVVRTAANDGSGNPRETRFDVVKRSGCLWLRGRG